MKFTSSPVACLPFVTCLLLSSTPSLALAQDEEGGISFGAIQITASSDGTEAGGADVIAPALSSISIGGPGGFFSSSTLGGIDPNNRSQLFDLLNNQSIKQELKLTEDQVNGVKRIMQEHGKRMQDQIRRSMAEGNGRASFDMGEILKAKQQEAETAIEEILLPEQLKRIRQLAYQIEIANAGLGESLINGRLGQDVGVHDQQKQHLTDKAREVEAELRVAIAKAHAAARAKLFAELTPDQRKTAEELLGDFFQYEQDNLNKLIRQRLNDSKKSKETDENRKK